MRELRKGQEVECVQKRHYRWLYANDILQSTSKSPASLLLSQSSLDHFIARLGPVFMPVAIYNVLTAACVSASNSIFSSFDAMEHFDCTIMYLHYYHRYGLDLVSPRKCLRFTLPIDFGSSKNSLRNWRIDKWALIQLENSLGPAQDNIAALRTPTWVVKSVVGRDTWTIVCLSPLVSQHLLQKISN